MRRGVVNRLKQCTDVHSDWTMFFFWAMGTLQDRLRIGDFGISKAWWSVVCGWCIYWHHGIPWIPWLWSHDHFCARSWKARVPLPRRPSAHLTIWVLRFATRTFDDLPINWDTAWYGLRAISWKLLGSCWRCHFDMSRLLHASTLYSL